MISCSINSEKSIQSSLTSNILHNKAFITNIHDTHIGLQFQDWDQVYPHGGFGFVTYQHTGDTFHPVSYLDKAVSGAVAVFNSMEFGTELNSSNAPVVGPQDFKTKFKVVKVDTTQPLKRGRWTCIDFSDKSTSSASEVSKNAAASSGTGRNENGDDRINCIFRITN